MKYVVLSPHNKLICFDHSSQVEEYCLEKDNQALNGYCDDQEFTYETMTPVEIGYTYVASVAEQGGCKIYETRQVLDKMNELQVEAELIDRVNNIFNDRRLNNEIDCPSYLEDVLMEVTPIPASCMTDGVYIMDNVDSASDERNNSGV
nr:hypothetical protein [uncultured Cellulosilyticum sp.]